METRNTQQAEPYGIKTYHQACEEIRQLRSAVNNVKLSKSERSPLFAKLRALENFWGIDSIPYNGG